MKNELIYNLDNKSHNTLVAGIYSIDIKYPSDNSNNNIKRYIGASINLKDTYDIISEQLGKGIFTNSGYVQQLYNSRFHLTFTILDYYDLGSDFDVDGLIELNKIFIEQYNTKNIEQGFNN